MAWVAVGGMALGAVGSYLGSKGGKPGGITYAPSAYQSMNAGQKASTDSLMNNNTAYINNNMARINSGRAPEYAENMVNQLAPYLQQQNKRQFMGRPGDRSGSVMGLGSQNAAMMGLNPKARASIMGKTFMDYQQGQAAIDQQMGQYKFNASNQMAMALPGWATGQQQTTSDFSRVGSGTQFAAQPGKYAALGNAMGAAGGMMAANPNMFGGPKTSGVSINSTGGGGLGQPGGYSGMMPTGAGSSWNSVGGGNMLGGYTPYQY